MKVWKSATAASLLALALPHAALAQQQLGANELSRARALLEASRAELTPEQFALLSGKLAETEQAYAELIAVTRAAGETAAVAAEGGAAVAAGGRALLSGLSELLPLLLLVLPSTAHAPGLKAEKPQVQVAKAKLAERVEALAQAARQVDAERKAKASGATKPVKERKQPGLKPVEDSNGCDCICGPPKGQSSERARIGRYVEWRCRSICVEDYGFKYNEYVCQ